MSTIARPMSCEEFEYHRTSGLGLSQMDLASFLGLHVSGVTRYRSTEKNRDTQVPLPLSMHISRAVELKFKTKLIDALEIRDTAARKKQILLIQRAEKRFYQGLHDIRAKLK